MDARKGRKCHSCWPLRVSLSCGVLFVVVALFFLLCQVCGVTRFVFLSRQISRATERKHLLRVQEVRV